MADEFPIDVILRAKDEMSATLDKATKNVGLFSAAGSALGTIAGTAISGGLSLITEGLTSVAKAGIEGNAQFETYATQFGVLLGGAEQAKQRLAELAEFGAKTPFELPQVVEADKILQGFGLHSEEAAAKFGFSGEQIRTIAGDVASGTGAEFSEMSNLIGKFSAGATGEAISRMQELGITNREELTKMGLEFSKSGELLSPLPESMEVVLSLMQKKYGGMMDAQSSTFEGMVSNLQDWVGQSIREVSQPIFEVVSDSLKDVLKFLNEPGTKKAISDFAKGMADTLKGVVAWVKDNWPAISKTIGDVFSVIKWAWDNVLGPVLKVVFDVIGGIVKYFTDNWPQISAGFSTAAKEIEWIWLNILKPVLDAITGAFNWVMQAGKDVGNFLQNPIGNIQAGINNIVGGGVPVTTNNTFNLNANYPAQSPGTLRDDVRTLQMIYAGT
jgi:phage tail tape-measure protein